MRHDTTQSQYMHIYIEMLNEATKFEFTLGGKAKLMPILDFK
jgi:hypothetical protein